MMAKMMTKMIKLRIELFGAFRQYTDEENLEICLSPGASLKELREELGNALQNLSPSSAPTSIQGLIESSAFADERAVLNENLRLESDMNIAVLPPVCGG